jgi:hypothetical protein
MQSPAPVAKKIAGRTDSSDSSESSIDNIIENIEAIKSVTDLEDKKNRSEDLSSDSSGRTITEYRNNPPETEGGPVRAVEGSELPDPKVGISSNTSNDSSSNDSSSTGGSSKSDTDISSLDSSDST